MGMVMVQVLKGSTAEARPWSRSESNSPTRGDQGSCLFGEAKD